MCVLKMGVGVPRLSSPDSRADAESITHWHRRPQYLQRRFLPPRRRRVHHVHRRPQYLPHHYYSDCNDCYTTTTERAILLINILFISSLFFLYRDDRARPTTPRCRPVSTKVVRLAQNPPLRCACGYGLVLLRMKARQSCRAYNAAPES